jgi:hypothetical protein
MAHDMRDLGGMGNDGELGDIYARTTNIRVIGNGIGPMIVGKRTGNGDRCTIVGSLMERERGRGI